MVQKNNYKHTKKNKENCAKGTKDCNRVTSSSLREDAGHLAGAGVRHAEEIPSVQDLVRMHFLCLTVDIESCRDTKTHTCKTHPNKMQLVNIVDSLCIDSHVHLTLQKILVSFRGKVWSGSRRCSLTSTGGKGDETLPAMQGRAVCEAAAPPLGLATAGGRLSTKASSCLK